MKQLYIHCGLHKTGTTALQHALSEKRQALLKHHFLYPKIGVPYQSVAQHNLAWQLNRDRRFQTGLGDWDKLFAQFKDFDGAMVISSEDFETTLLKPSRWKAVIERAAKFEVQITFLIYLREPKSYFESLYLELLKHGCGEEFINVFNSVMLSGKLSERESEYGFDYHQIKAAMSSIPNAVLVFRSYSDLIGNSVIEDFEHVLKIAGLLKVPGLANKTINVRKDLNYNLRLFARNRLWSWFGKKDLKAAFSAIDIICKQRQYKLVMPEKLENLFNKRFIKSIQFIEALQLKQVVSDMAIDDTKQSNDDSLLLVDMQRAFSFESHLVIKQIASLISHPDYIRDNSSVLVNKKIQEVVNTWWSWVTLSSRYGGIIKGD
jgi:hypothetical protein